MNKVIFFHGDTVFITKSFAEPTHLENGTVAYNGFSDRWYLFNVEDPINFKWHHLTVEKVDPLYRMKLLLIT